jgi:hypothetical protein
MLALAILWLGAPHTVSMYSPLAALGGISKGVVAKLLVVVLELVWIGAPPKAV